MKKNVLIAFLFIALLASGCYYDVEEELYGACDVNPATTKFSNSINPLFNSYNCLGCHGGSNSSGGVNLSTYAGVKTVVDNGRLFGAVSHAPGFSPMPQGGGKMSECDIKKIKAWIDAGAPNN